MWLNADAPGLFVQQLAQVGEVSIDVGIAHAAPYVAQESGASKVPGLERGDVCGRYATQGHHLTVNEPLLGGLAELLLGKRGGVAHLGYAVEDGTEKHILAPWLAGRHLLQAVA